MNTPIPTTAPKRKRSKRFQFYLDAWFYATKEKKLEPGSFTIKKTGPREMKLTF